MNKSQTPRYIIFGLIFTWALYSIWPSIEFQTLSQEKKETMREEGTMDILEDKVTVSYTHLTLPTILLV